MFQLLKNKIKNNSWLKIAIQLLLVLLLMAGIGAWKTKDAVRGEAPMIVGELLSGEPFNLSEHRGKPVLVHFWATWCPVCQFENSTIDQLSNDYTVISLASWSKGKAEVMAFMRAENVHMPVLLDTDGEWAKLYGVKAVPASFILNKQGNIQFVTSGFTTSLGLRLRLWWASI